ncbi:hypothetical protein EVAR_33649_1 [Eumeta japonica]|uniref:Uncharacterized protein n=1 Tax=Eumeta variegata TaxID=151549 RepID=A0A4C1VLZ3_EUMVA|nr:hypothetical protein EVAR_33649_1 [Eumeta japonica]
MGVERATTYPGLGFGPNGPVAPLPDAVAVTALQTTPASAAHAAPSATTKPATKRSIVVAAFEFHRVETPFLIGLWIFFASIAKIVAILLLISMPVSVFIPTPTFRYRSQRK